MSSHIAASGVEMGIGRSNSSDDASIPHDSGECRVLLPFDVISHIMSHSTPSTISALMKTCHAYYREGPKHLLRDGDVLIYASTVARFMQFILAQDGARFAYFRRLEITFGQGKSSVIEQSAELLANPQLSLETLVLCEAERLLKFDRFASSFRTTNPVKTLILQDSGPQTCSALQTLGFCLVDLTVSFGRYVSWPKSENGLGGDGWSHLIDSLSSHSHTLEVLRCDSGPSGVSLPRHSLPSTSTPSRAPRARFGAVRTLGLVCTPSSSRSKTPFDLASLVHMFPNVNSLELIPNSYRGSIASRIASSESPGATDKAANLEHGGCWAVLTKCSGELASLCSIGLVCHVVDLYIWDEIDSDEQLAMLVPIVLSVRPKCLRLAVEGVETLGGVISALRNPGVEALEMLHVVLAMYELYTEGTALDLAEFIFEALKLLPPQVTTLDLFIEFKGNYTHTPKPDSRALKELGRRLTEAAPTLRHVLVRHADGYRLQPPNGLHQASDDSDSYMDGSDSYDDSWGFSDDSWEYGDSDGYDSDFARRCAHSDW
ncbi:hypothetical protein OH76DRAFT_1560147 [Lentinus brumalis]|uniref:F-box domain-containing protein n=1 Tax=Lentinus brumalis TaxID=2498619 RepID=A0A371CTX3_9APHY|nr:hypothetical protein OH76DRAFT_1560147 [Polyporus brumalis]